MENIERIEEYLRQRARQLPSYKPDTIHGVFTDPKAEMADLTVTDLQALLALVREQQAKLDAVTKACNFRHGAFVDEIRAALTATGADQ